MFTHDGRSDDGGGDGGFDGGINLYVLDGCWSDHAVWYTGSSDRGHVLHQGYDWGGMFCYTACDGYGQSDAQCSDHESCGGVLAGYSGSDSWGSDSGFDTLTDLYVLDGCWGDGGVRYSDNGDSGDVLH
jgi:hypothetical protein